MAASGNLGQVIKRKFQIAGLNRIDEPLTKKLDVVGSLCTSLDMLARNVELPVVSDGGDLVGICQSGAYAHTARPAGFLSHPNPAEVLVQDGTVTPIPLCRTYEDLLTDALRYAGLPALRERTTCGTVAIPSLGKLSTTSRAHRERAE